MSFLGRNINLGLITLILILVLLFAGVVVLYQRGLAQRTTEYETTSSNLTQCLTTLDNFRDRLAQTETQLDSTSQDIQKYDTLYEQKVAELGDKDRELRQTRSELNGMTLQKEQYKNLYGKSLLNISAQQGQITKLNDDITSLKATIRSLQNQLDACEGS